MRIPAGVMASRFFAIPATSPPVSFAMFLRSKLIAPRSRNVPSSSVSDPWCRRRMPLLLMEKCPRYREPRQRGCFLRLLFDYAADARRGAFARWVGGAAREPKTEGDPVEVLAVL